MLALNVAENLLDLPADNPPSASELFNSLVNSHADYLYRYAYWLCQNQALAEDLVQETFLRAWKHFAKLQDIRTAKSWLTTILRREHARLYERAHARFDFDSDIALESLPAAVDNDTRPEAFALREAFTKLPDKFRDPLILQVLGGYSCEDIARILGLSKGAVMTRLFRAKEKLRQTLVRDDRQPAQA